ncbi:MAG: helix-turn-helix transcriptional regulator [Verrucomicrobia bacterium]|nr:helix-turn-helix transcriptional regulator [Verrucomicrobiota bacterium]
MISPMSAVGDRIRARRLELGWTQEKLAGEAGVSKGFLSDLESGKRNVGAETLLSIATVLGVSMDYLMKGGPVRVETGDVQIPGSLAAFARSAGLTFAQALTLLEMQRQIVAYRSDTKRRNLEEVDWRRFYESVKEFM